MVTASGFIQAAQAWFGIEADIANYGKIVGGGMPIGIIAGKAVYMDAIDGGMWNYEIHPTLKRKRHFCRYLL